MPLRRARVAAEGWRPLAGSTRWQPLAGAGGVAAVIAYFETRDQCVEAGLPPCLGVGNKIMALRLAAVVIGIGAAFLLDDPAEDTLAHVPTPRIFTRALRLLLAMPLAGMVWALCVAVAMRTGGAEPFPLRQVTLEAGALWMVAVAASAGAARLVPERLGGIAGGPLLLLLTVAAILAPARFRLFVPEPAEPRWKDAHDLWAWVLFTSVLLAAWWSRDPGARPIRRMVLGSGTPRRDPETHPAPVSRMGRTGP